ncbi:uncharacterized protein LOC132400951 [Hypanus sabinus]|uniref:uncharacterized protein LOC132400951 n=1 Tax=Hypanus sabinus TaxID=79690 RepID=UPI0028C3CA75|nr:uncharacterized protein LOC132400951 [Hypanus sabinus]
MEVGCPSIPWCDETPVLKLHSLKLVVTASSDLMTVRPCAPHSPLSPLFSSPILPPPLPIRSLALSLLPPYSPPLNSTHSSLPFSPVFASPTCSMLGSLSSASPPPSQPLVLPLSLHRLLNPQLSPLPTFLPLNSSLLLIAFTLSPQSLLSLSLCLLLPLLSPSTPPLSPSPLQPSRVSPAFSPSLLACLHPLHLRSPPLTPGFSPLSAPPLNLISFIPAPLSPLTSLNSPLIPHSSSPLFFHIHPSSHFSPSLFNSPTSSLHSLGNLPLHPSISLFLNTPPPVLPLLYILCPLPLTPPLPLTLTRLPFPPCPHLLFSPPISRPLSPSRFGGRSVLGVPAARLQPMRLRVWWV